MSKKNDAEQATNILPTLTRGHKKKQRTRQGLLDAALRLFARKEVFETGLLDLAEEADVSTGTIYNYFRTREEVAEAVGIAMASEYSEGITRLSLGIENGAQRIAIGVRLFILRAIDDPDWASALVRIVHFDKGLRSTLAMHVQADLRTGAEQGHLTFTDESIALDIVIACATAGMRSAVECRAVEQHDEKVAEMVLNALGVTPVKAKKLASQPLPHPDD